MQTVTSNSWHLHKANILSSGMSDTLPSEFDVVVVGTGLVESMVAAAASRMGHTTLHVDTANFYGGDWASFTLTGLQEWIKDTNNFEAGEIPLPPASDLLLKGEKFFHLGNNRTNQNLVQNWATSSNHKAELDTKNYDREAVPDEHLSDSKDCSLGKNENGGWNEEKLMAQSRKFNIDLTPRLLFSRGAMVELLISSNISRYTEFKSVTRVLTVLDGKLEQVPSSRSDVFNTKHISVIEKRILMKFLTHCLQTQDDNNDTSETFGDYLKFHKLTPNLVHFIVHSIAMTPLESPRNLGLNATRKFLSSLGRFGPTPFLWSMYGTGELPQAFCRLCAVFGGIYYLGRNIDGIVVKDDNVVSIVVEGKRVGCKYLVLPSKHVPVKFECNDVEVETTSRGVFISSQSLLPTENEQITFLSLPREDGKYISVIEVGAGTAACPKGLHVLHASSKESEDIDSLLRREKIINEQDLLYSLTFNQLGKKSDGKTKLSNMWSASGPMPELDLDIAISQAKNIYTGMFPGEEFLPRAPDPEEIILGDEGNEDINDAPGAGKKETVVEQENTV